MKKTVTIILIVSIILLFIQETVAQEGWRKTQKNDALVYIPSDIERSKTFRISISKPVKLNGKDFKKWFLNEAKSQQITLGKPLQKWIVKPDKNGDRRVSNTFVSTNGEKMKVGYQGFLLKDGNAYIVQIIFGANDLTASMKNAAQLDKVFQDAEDTFGNSYSLTTVTQSKIKKHTASPESTKAIRPDFKALKSIADI
ncbi:MAG: hypothetical protein L3J53_03640 [Proteobacteria bacterium]|nr:hypothetical protein [Pseudomonadota bacterium]